MVESNKKDCKGGKQVKIVHRVKKQIKKSTGKTHKKAVDRKEATDLEIPISRMSKIGKTVRD
jgi:hypothetical protein